MTTKTKTPKTSKKPLTAKAWENAVVRDNEHRLDAGELLVRAGAWLQTQDYEAVWAIETPEEALRLYYQNITSRVPKALVVGRNGKAALVAVK